MLPVAVDAVVMTLGLRPKRGEEANNFILFHKIL